MNAPPASDQIRTTAPLALWRVAHAFLHILHALFSGPGQVAFRHTLTLKAHRFMSSWLRCGETMMRRLLLIEAQSFAKPNTRPLLRAVRKRTRKPVIFSEDAPEKWRVSFRCLAATRRLSPPKAGKAPQPIEINAEPAPFIFREDRPARQARPNPHRKRGARRQARRSQVRRQDRDWQLPKPAFRSAWPLAERYEALLRAFNAPLAYAKRLARLLHARPYRTRDVLAASPEARHRIDRYAELTNAAEASAAVFNSG